METLSPIKGTTHSREAQAARQRIVFAEGSPIEKCVAMAERLAKADAPVLINGETGTGKELFARLIHYSSSRNKGPFVAVNCAAIPETLLESELFGHVKGAFTGAVNARRGRFELARGGTLFLDEIGDMPVRLQPKLLRVLQEMLFEPIGSCTPQKADVRIIAATHRDLTQQVNENHFRADLFFRLNVLNLNLPPLRQHTTDIDTLASHFVAVHSSTMGMPSPTLTDRANAALNNHVWPGNVRELENILYRAVVLAEDGVIDDTLIVPATGGATAECSDIDRLNLPDVGVKLPRLLQSLEHNLINQALERTGGNRARAANLLGLNRTTLVEKLRKCTRAEAAA